LEPPIELNHVTVIVSDTFLAFKSNLTILRNTGRAMFLQGNCVASSLPVRAVTHRHKRVDKAMMFAAAAMGGQLTDVGIPSHTRH
jgi:hypothetical protein